MDGINIDVAYPQHPLIRQYVDYYYVLNPQKDDLNICYTAYPNTFQPVIFFEHTRVSVEGSEHSLQNDPTAPYYCGVIGRFTNALTITLHGRIRTINIIFKELGLNSFIKKPYNKIVKFAFQELDDWAIDDRTIASLFLLTKNDLEAKLDEILLTRFTAFSNPILSRAIDLMKCDTSLYDLKEIEHRSGLNRKNLFRLFVTHTGISPTAFRRVMRFRQMIELKKNEKLSLTALAYKANFADQSHLIKEVHKLTGDAPLYFIKNARYVNGSKFLIKSTN